MKKHVIPVLILAAIIIFIVIGISSIRTENSAKDRHETWSDWTPRDHITVDGQKVYVGMIADSSFQVLNPDGSKRYMRSDPLVIPDGDRLQVTHYFQFQKGKLQVDITYQNDGHLYRIVEITKRKLLSIEYLQNGVIIKTIKMKTTES